MTMNNLLNEIQKRLPGLSKGQQRIANFITASYEQAAFMTAAKLGETVGVSESTVVRFAYALGLDGYPALQDRMQEMVLGRLTSVQRAQLASGIKKNEVFKTVLNTDMNSIRTTMEMADEGQFEEAVETILKARKVYVLGLRSAMPLAMFLAYYLDYICGRLHLHQLPPVQHPHRRGHGLRQVPGGQDHRPDGQAGFAHRRHGGRGAAR